MSQWLVVNADDLGVSRSATLGVIKAHREGIVTSASLAVTTSAYTDAVATCVRTCPDLGIGLHFTLTSGKPVSEGVPASLLVDARGFFRWRFLPLFAAVALQRRADLLALIASELDAQLDKLAADGIRPDHIDSERHVHLIPGIFELVVAAARRRGIPFVRAGTDVGPSCFPLWRVPGLALRGGVTKSWLLSGLAHRAHRHLEGIRTAEHVSSYFGTGQTFLLKQSRLNAPRGTGGMELMVHPGVPQANDPIELGNRGLERYLRSDDRRRELDFCIEARSWIDRGPLTNYTRLAAESRLS